MDDYSWAISEFGEAEFGDHRLSKRLVKLADSLSEFPMSSINQACGDWSSSKAAYRFFQNDKIDVSQISSTHKDKTISRIQEHQTVLAIQDTCYFTYTDHPETSGLGILTKKKGANKDEIKTNGLIMHTSFAVSDKGLPLGILDQNICARKEESKEVKELRKKSHGNALSIEDKESMRWLNSLTNSHNPLKEAKTKLVTVCDREADIFDFFESAYRNQASVLVRAHHDRVINTPSPCSNKNKRKLWEFVQKTSSQGKTEVKIPSQKNKLARTATMDIHYTSLTINHAKNNIRKRAEKLPKLTLFAIYVIEKNPPKGTDALEWMLLTNIPVISFDAALEKIRWYCLRWRIEIFHKVLKSGLKVEDCRLNTADKLIKYLTIMSIIAYRIYFTTLIARTNPDLSCDILLTEYEWKVLYSRIHKNKNYPDKLPSIKEAVKWIAQLGGFLARKNDGNPGVTTIWRGWRRLTDLSDGWRLANEIKTYG